MQPGSARFLRRFGVLSLGLPAMGLLATTLASCLVVGPQDDGPRNENEGIDSSWSGQGGSAATQAGVGGGVMSSTGGGGPSVTVASSSNVSSSSGGPSCGDGMCDAGENCQNCGEDCSKGGAPVSTTGLDSEEQAFLQIINAYRAQNGLGALAACKSLNRTAQGHSEDMRDQNYFSHDGLNGSEPWDRACDACYELGCGPMTAMAENIAAGNASAQKTFTQWKNSPGHDKNMKGASFEYIGIGRATGGGQFGSYWTNVFGGAHEMSCD
jgi:uncharacterized protein YkwD